MGRTPGCRPRSPGWQLYTRQGICRKEGQDKANALHARTKERLLSLSAGQTPEDLPDWETLPEKVAPGRAGDREWRLYRRGPPANICAGMPPT